MLLWPPSINRHLPPTNKTINMELRALRITPLTDPYSPSSPRLKFLSLHLPQPMLQPVNSGQALKHPELTLYSQITPLSGQDVSARVSNHHDNANGRNNWLFWGRTRGCGGALECTEVILWLYRIRTNIVVVYFISSRMVPQLYSTGEEEEHHPPLYKKYNTNKIELFVMGFWIIWFFFFSVTNKRLVGKIHVMPKRYWWMLFSQIFFSIPSSRPEIFTL